MGSAFPDCRYVGTNEGAYHPVNNPDGYARLLDIRPGLTTSEIYEGLVIHHKGDF